MDNVTSTTNEETYFWQFNGQVDKHNYREYRVKSLNLATTSQDVQHLNKRIQEGFKRIQNQHNNKVLELEKKIRHHHQMTKQWAILEQSTTEHNREIVARMLDSSEKFIEEFEKENFGPASGWSWLIKIGPSKDIKHILATVKQLNKDGNEINISNEKQEETSLKELQSTSERLNVKPEEATVEKRVPSKTGEKGSQTAIVTNGTNSINSCSPSDSQETLSIEISPITTNAINSSSSGSSSRSSLNNKKKGKKGKKGHKGPKMTLEEIEAIKKKKKEDADRAFEKKHKEMRDHLEKVEKSERHKIHRRLAETALEILRRGSGILPPEIQELNAQLDTFVKVTGEEEKYQLRDEYLKTRVEELTRTLIGPELATKMELMAVYEIVIERCCHLQQYLMFLASLEKDPQEFEQFEIRTISFYLKGYEEDHDIKNKDQELNFEKFRSEFLVQIPESEKWSYAREFVDNRLNAYRNMKNSRSMTQNELFLEEAYVGIENIIEVFNKCSNVIAFLQQNKTHTAFNLMEAWFLESRRPPPLEPHY